SNAGATQNDTRGPSGVLSLRVLRGGDWDGNADFARCAARNGNGTPSSANYYAFGFRCVRGL
ncbi:MAG: SUMF1/EgtB/PvdO family nonheme iron enzyme, partial [Verrucomicrobiota bacterium]